jgi:membrane protein DedA with SNARE-associated domain/pimeloyl-ACP methyl ester carboxylesterase
MKSLLRRRTLVLLYVIALVASHLVRWTAGEPALLPGQADVRLPAMGGAGTVRLAYQDLPGPTGATNLPVLLIHGSPASACDLQALAVEIARSRRVIVPDLPGFGRSTRDVPDLSIRAQADYLRRLLDHLDVMKFHVLGFSYGGGVALHLQHDDAQRVASLALVSSIGVQELELLGDYGLNHALHGLQLGGLWLLHELVPHMGALDGAMLDPAYARSFYHTDQRPLRGLLASVTLPTLVVHGRNDVLVPPSAAREHHRLVPQSDLLMREDGHLMVYQRAPELAAALQPFWSEVEQGRARTRSTADPKRVAEAAIPFSEVGVAPAIGLALVILITLIALGTLVSEDLACIGAGLMVAHGALTYPWAAFAAFIGIFVGDLLLFAAGRLIGRPALRRAPIRWFIKEGALQESTEWFARRGPAVILFSRFVPGSRLPTYFAAGMLHLSFWSFFIFFLVAGLLWAPLLVWLASTVGESVLDYLERFRHYTLPALALAAVLLWLIWQILIPLASYRGRRQLVGRWRRLTQFEYWPLWVVYAPVLPYILWLGLRHRKPLLFTAANPAIPAGGLLGESKAGILDGLSATPDAVAAYRLLPAGLSPEAFIEGVHRFMADQRLTFPIVLKPDVGQRGLGVAVLREEAALRRYAEKKRPATVVQAYVSGPEFGVFYARPPDQAAGRIISITRKQFPVLTGDGRRTLERLILSDRRAVCMAKVYLARFRERLSWVPAPGERIPLVDIGNHCRGTIFLDGGELNTPALAAALDRVARPFAGFAFGRFDLRAESEEALAQGRAFKIMELNGVTSECTHIYDPKHSAGYGWRTLFAQWRLAFEIGAAQAKQGARVLTIREFFHMLRDYEPAGEA